MPLGEIAVEFIGVTIRFVGRFFAEVFLEIAIKGLGYLICRLFSKSPDPDSAIVTIVGIVAWVAIISLCIFSYGWVQEYLSVDSCLDSGGKYNYEDKTCISG